MVLAIGLVFRVIVTFFVVMGGDLTAQERLFIAFAWFPKATVQAGIITRFPYFLSSEKTSTYSKILNAGM